MTTTLEELLRCCTVKRGAILMSILDGEFGVTITHHQGHQTHPMGKWHSDPVDALTAALIEDERVSRDLSRRYAEAPKGVPEREETGSKGQDLGADVPEREDEFEGLFD